VHYIYYLNSQEIQIEPQDSFIDDVRKIKKEENELDIPTKISLAYVNFQTIQKSLFDFKFSLSKTDVQRAANRAQTEDYYLMMIKDAIESDYLKNIVTGKR